ncbi:hypothetical protein NL108_018550, partial [Boleophthalmus pectinirostris]
EEFSNCVSELSPGPHAFLLLLPIRKINEQDQDSLELIKNKLGEKVVDYVIVVFTGGDQLDENYTIENYIEECDVFVKDLLKECKNRYHVLNNTNETNRHTNVTKLMDTVNKLTQGGARAYTKDMFLEAVIEEVPKSLEMNLSLMPLRIALIGKSGSYKSTSANIILGEKCLQPNAARTHENTTCEKVSRMVQGRTVTTVVIPPLFGDSFSEEVSKCVSELSPGPHAFLLLLPIGKINKQDQDSLQLIKNRLGEKVADYVMIIFTRGEVLNGNYTIKNYIEECDVFVKDLINQCKNRYHVLNTNETNDTQVAELLKKIDKMMQENSCSCFTQEMLQITEIRKDAQRKIQEKENIET